MAFNVSMTIEPVKKYFQLNKNQIESVSEISLAFLKSVLAILQCKVNTRKKALVFVSLKGDTNRPVKRLACGKLACYLGVTSNFRFFRFS